MQELEWREKQYDGKFYLDVFEQGSTEPALQHVLTYVGTPGDRNQNWAGEASLPELAQQIASAHGPSGPNFEYLYLLAEGLRKVRSLA